VAKDGSVPQPLTTVLPMGKNNKARRAAKAKARAHRRPDATREHTAPRGDSDRRVDVDDLVYRAARQLALGTFPYRVREIAVLAEAPPARVHRALDGELGRVIVALWDAGWQPAELARHAKRTGPGVVEELVRHAVAADHARRAPDTLDPRWADQLERLGLPADIGDAGRWWPTWVQRHGTRTAAITCALECVAMLRTLPQLEVLIPPPGAGPAVRTTAAAADVSGVDRVMLDKVRALLTKAESTTYEAEAAVFTAKAHELMTRHAIDAAMLAAGDQSHRGTDAPTMIRVAIDDPYADAKSLLLQVIAQANRCRSIFMTRVSMSTVIGYRADLDATELLYTSLLLQAQRTLAEVGRGAAAGARTRSQSFRSAFLLAYVHRVGERLAEVTDRLTAEADTASSGSLLPVLRSRELAIDEHVRDRYGDLSARPVRGGHDALGWATGTEAGNTADLGHRRLAG
jgi:Protein of unknown function (DUF2786)